MLDTNEAEVKKWQLSLYNLLLEWSGKKPNVTRAMLGRLGEIFGAIGPEAKGSVEKVQKLWYDCILHQGKHQRQLLAMPIDTKAEIILVRGAGVSRLNGFAGCASGGSRRKRFQFCCHQKLLRTT